MLRVTLGVIFLTHGLPKIMGGVGGLEGMLGEMGVPLAGIMAWVVTLLEVGGGLALVVGFLVTAFSLLLSFHMLMGIFLVHLANGWYVIGPGSGGAEFNVLLIAGLLTLVLAGPGAAALDARQEEALT
jgi:putative oxidoreductase